MSLPAPCARFGQDRQRLAGAGTASPALVRALAKLSGSTRGIAETVSGKLKGSTFVLDPDILLGTLKLFAMLAALLFPLQRSQTHFARP